MTFSIKTLEFNLIKEIISKETFSNYAFKEINNLVPSNNYEFVLRSLNETNELLNLIARNGKLPFLSNFDNIILAVKRIDRVYMIDELLYLRLFLTMSSEITKYYKESIKNTKLKYINYYFELFDSKKILEELNLTFDHNGEIFDNATIELKQIRNKIRNLNNNLNVRMSDLVKKYSTHLSEETISIRNNRSVLAVKEGSKNKIKGVIHDLSQSKQTVFIEPEISLQINAEIELNKLLEEKEIEKILIRLTTLVNANYDELKTNLILLTKLDTLHAKALYSFNTNGVLPKINNEGLINLIDAKHPLIKKEDVVPISLKINKNNNVLLITGPNTGGKTVSLKTVGLITVMVQSGILVQVKEESGIAIFDNIFVDIGDEQSLETSLSTFSSHMTKIISFINNLTNNSLILLDELGSGTDPNEGVSLAIAIIEKFLEKDIRMVVTSHFSELKTYAYEKDGVLLASVDFDPKTLKPLYSLKHGIIGESHARLIAKRLGLPADVLKKADDLFFAKETELNKIISKLNLEKEALLVKQKNIKVLEEKYNKGLVELKAEHQRLLDEQEKTLINIQTKEEKLWLKKVDEVNKLIKEIEEEKNAKDPKIASLKGLVNLKDQKDSLDTNIKEIKIDDYVYIKPYSQYGYVSKINNGNYTVSFGAFNLEFKRSDLVLKEKQEDKKIIKAKKSKVTNNHNYDTSSSLNVDLRGLRVHEIKDVLDKAIDQALLSNIYSLTVIHGYGTFAIKKAVDDYIRKSKFIKASRIGGEGEGLMGVTIITL